MADIATPSAATMSSIDAGSEPVADKAQRAKPEKPEKPDEQKYKESLAKAEKEYAAAQEKFVSCYSQAQYGRSKLTCRYRVQSRLRSISLNL